LVKRGEGTGRRRERRWWRKAGKVCEMRCVVLFAGSAVGSRLDSPSLFRKKQNRKSTRGRTRKRSKKRERETRAKTYHCTRKVEDRRQHINSDSDKGGDGAGNEPRGNAQ
jgi:hypothetical protein